ncbi:MAG: hypothetical protein GX786_07110, partial [Clostridiales bacterium]|nr:hypothetical protein [Clostridiales bacterium]
MAIVSYCKKCKMEVPLSDTCINCGKKLPKTSQRLSWYYENHPVKDWISWNNIMRIFLPVLLLLILIVLIAEGLGRGSQGIVDLVTQGLLSKVLLVGAILVVGIVVILLLQGKEVVQTIIDHQGIHTYTFISVPTKMRWYLRLQSPRKKGEGVSLTAHVEEKHLLWKDIKGISLWPDK